MASPKKPDIVALWSGLDNFSRPIGKSLKLSIDKLMRSGLKYTTIAVKNKNMSKHIQTTTKHQEHRKYKTTPQESNATNRFARKIKPASMF